MTFSLTGIGASGILCIERSKVLTVIEIDIEGKRPFFEQHHHTSGGEKMPKLSALKIARMESGMPQWRVASLLGVDRTVLSEYENGRRHASYEVRMRLSKVLEKPVEALFPDENA